MTKKTSAGTSKDHNDTDPFSLQKWPVCPPSSSVDAKELQPSAKSLLREECADAAQVVTLASNSVEYAMKSAQVPMAIQETINEEHSQPVLLPEASSYHAPEPLPSSTPAMPQDTTLAKLTTTFSQHDMESIHSARGPPAADHTPPGPRPQFQGYSGPPFFPPPAAAHTEKKDKAAGGLGFSSQCNVNGPPAAPVSAHEIGADGSHKHVPYPPAGWFGPLGPGPQFQGYPRPPFFPPYNGWGTFSNMDHAHQGGAAAPQPGCYGRSPYDLPGFYFGEQPFGFPNGYPSANMSNMPGTSDGGCAAQDTASGGNAK